MNITELSLRVTLSFIVLLVLTRIMGRKELSQMTFFNFVSAVAIGSIGANLAVSSNLSIRNGVLALIGWSILTIVMGYIDIKSKAARNALTGQPIIVIKNGQIMGSEMRKARLDVDSLNSMLREKKVFSITDVEYAVFETNGKLSILKKEYKEPATKSDIGATPQTYSYTIPTEVISDGKINNNNLQSLQLDEKWLNQQLSQAGVEDISKVFYAEVQKDGTLYIDNKDDVVH